MPPEHVVAWLHEKHNIRPHITEWRWMELPDLFWRYGDKSDFDVSPRYADPAAPEGLRKVPTKDGVVTMSRVSETANAGNDLWAGWLRGTQVAFWSCEIPPGEHNDNPALTRRPAIHNRGVNRMEKIGIYTDAGKQAASDKEQELKASVEASG